MESPLEPFSLMAHDWFLLPMTYAVVTPTLVSSKSKKLLEPKRISYKL